jgi:hypothetical protein
MLLALLLLTAHAGDPPPTAVEDADLTAADFTCLREWTRVDRTYVTNVRGHQAEAEAALRDGGAYPVGTIIQLFPGEAMVKRAPGFSPETGDWEFLVLKVKKGETVIADRGTTDVRNAVGTCLSCHAEAEPQWDLVCRTGHGCKDLPGFAVKLAARKVAKDGRCPAE